MEIRGDVQINQQSTKPTDQRKYLILLCYFASLLYHIPHVDFFKAPCRWNQEYWSGPDLPTRDWKFDFSVWGSRFQNSITDPHFFFFFPRHHQKMVEIPMTQFVLHGAGIYLPTWLGDFVRAHCRLILHIHPQYVSLKEWISD